MIDTDLSVEIRPFLQRDLDQMKRIEKVVFSDYPWTSEDFVIFLRKLDKNHEAYVADFRENIVGFMLVERNEWDYKIINLAITPEFRHKKIGSRFIEELKNRLVPYGREEISAYVSEKNKNAQQFFKTQGFKAVDILNDYFGNEAAYKFKYELQELPLKPEYAHL